MQRIETTAGAVSLWASFLTAFTSLFGWLTSNATMCGLLIAAGGLGVQVVSSRRNERRKDEEHALRMALLRSKLDDELQEDEA